MKRNVLLNLWLGHAKNNFEIIRCDQNTLSDLSKLVISISQMMLDYEYSQIKLIQTQLGIRNFQFHHYIADYIWK